MSANIIRRAAPWHDFAAIQRSVMRDERLGVDHLGLLCYLLSQPEHWETRRSHLEKRFGIGRDKLQRLMRELRAAGYARILKTRCAKTGAWLGSRTMIFDEPQDVPEVLDDSADEPEESGESGAGGPVDGPGINGGDAGVVACSPQPENPVLRGEPENPAAGKHGSPRDIRIDRYISPLKSPSAAADAAARGPAAPGDAQHRPAGAASSREGSEPTDGLADTPAPEAPIPRNATQDPTGPSESAPHAFWTPGVDAGWRAFAAVWPFDPSEDRERARKKFGGLGGADRALAVRHAADHALALEKGLAKRVSARTWLGARTFALWAGGQIALPREPVFVRKPGPGFASPAFEAWAQRWREERGTQPMFTFFSKRHGAEGVLRPSLFPPRRERAETTDPPNVRAEDLG